MRCLVSALLLVAALAAPVAAPVAAQDGGFNAPAINRLTGDVTTSAGGGSQAATVGSIQGTAVTGVTGSGNLVFSASPVFSGTVTMPATQLVGATCKLTSVITANTACTLPAGAVIQQVIVQNTTGNVITGGLKFGTTAGATDIVAALAVGATSLNIVASAAILKPLFSTSATQQIFIDAVAAWNSASANIWILYWVLP